MGSLVCVGGGGLRLGCGCNWVVSYGCGYGWWWLGLVVIGGVAMLVVMVVDFGYGGGFC